MINLQRIQSVDMMKYFKLFEYKHPGNRRLLRISNFSSRQWLCSSLDDKQIGAVEEENLRGSI